MRKLAIVTTHPIQYNAPLFQLLTQRGYIRIKVFYTWGADILKDKYDPGFGKNIEWDIPLLQGYEYSFVTNTSLKPGSGHFNGIINPGVIKEIEQWDPDAVLVYGWSFKSHLQVLRYFHGRKPVLFRGDSTILDEEAKFSYKKLLRTVALRWIYRHVNKALFAGRANKAYFLKYGLGENQLIFAPHAVDNYRFMEKNENWRPLLKIPADAVVFLFTGKFEEKKNPLLLLEAFIQLNDAGSCLVFAGSGALESKLKERLKIANHNCQNRVRFIGFQNQAAMPSIYQAADVFVLPSKGPGETWGLSVNEAMAAGLPVIVSDKCGCHSDLVRQGENGYVFSANNIEELSKSMKTIVSEKGKLKRMGLESQKIIQQWSFVHICEAVEKVVINLNLEKNNNPRF